MQADSPTKSLAVGLSIIIAILLTVTLFGTSMLLGSRDRFEKVIHEYNRKIELANNMHQYARMRMILLHNMLITHDPFVRDEHLSEYREAGSRFLHSREELLKLPQSQQDLQMLEQQRLLAIQSVQAQRRLIALIQDSQLDIKLHTQYEKMIHSDVMPLQDKVIEMLDWYIELQAGSVLKIEQDTEYASKRIQLIFSLMMIAAFIVSTYIAVIVNQHFRKTLNLVKNRELTERTIRENILDGLITIDAHGIIESANPAAHRMFAYPRGEMIGKKVNMLMPQPHKAKHDQYLQQYLRTGEARIIGIGREVIALKKDGTEFPVELAVQQISIENRKLFIGLIHDVSERHAAEQKLLQHQQELEQRVTQRTTELQLANERLSRMANYDTLTGLPNRAMLNTQLELIHNQSIQRNEQYALLYIDLDGFKNINDQYGHETGDIFLQETGHRMHSVLRSNDVIARVGGDEFVVLIMNLKEDEYATSIAEKIRQAISVPQLIKAQECKATASIGICVFPTDASNPSDILRNADMAMYNIKNTGKNGIFRYQMNNPPTPKQA